MMFKGIPILALFLGLLVVTQAEDDSDTLSQGSITAYEYLAKNTMFGDLINVGCALKGFLSDRDANDAIFKFTKGISEFFQSALECANPILLSAVNNRTSSLGSLVNYFRLGKTSEITRLDDLIREIVLTPRFVPLFLFGNVQKRLEVVVPWIKSELEQKCLPMLEEKYEEGKVLFQKVAKSIQKHLYDNTEGYNKITT